MSILDNQPQPMERVRSQPSQTPEVLSCSECPYGFIFKHQYLLHKHMKRCHNNVYQQMLSNGQIPSAACQRNTTSPVTSQRQEGETDEPHELHGDEQSTTHLTRPGGKVEVEHQQTCMTGKKTHQRVDIRERRPFPCEQCEKTFDRSDSLRKHQRIHTGEKAFVCTQCQKSFNRLDNLKRHQDLHTGEKPFQCIHCSKRFSLLGNMTAHQNLHSGEKPFHCEKCDKSFSSSSHLKLHRRLHTGEKPFHCNQCDKTFSQSSHLKTHQRAHTGERPFLCEQCEKTFSRLDGLKAHQHVHTGEKPFHCDQCDESFVRSDSMKKHKHLLHSPQQRCPTE